MAMAMAMATKKYLKRFVWILMGGVRRISNRKRSKPRLLYKRNDGFMDASRRSLLDPLFKTK